MTKVLDLLGKSFNRLTVLSRAATSSAAGKSIWLCQCLCGNIKEVISSNLINGHTKSCGCLKIESFSKAKYIVHGHARKGAHTSEYGAWHSMHSRCTNPNTPNYHRYGGRGITVCERWDKFKNFLDDMGTCQSGMSIDRKDNDLGYSPDNCRWATRKQQSNNRENNKIFTHNGKSMTISEWAEGSQVEYSTLRRRLMRGWGMDRAQQAAIDAQARK